MSSTDLTHGVALAIVRHVSESAPGPVSVVVVDDHGEVVASLRMDGAALDTELNARRKAYTAARSDATTTRALAVKVAVLRPSWRASTRSSRSSSGVSRSSSAETVSAPWASAAAG